MDEQDELDALLCEQNGARTETRANAENVWHDGPRNGVPGIPFRKGNPGGGRPPGGVDLMAICRRRAKESGTDLEEMIWAAFRGMALRAAKKGDAAAGKVTLDRACGMQEKASVVQVGVGVEVNPNDREVVLPPRRALAQQLLDIREAATKILHSEDELDALLE